MSTAITTMNKTTIFTAVQLLRQAAEELQQSHTTSRDRNDWTGEEDAKASYDEHMAVAAALEASVQLPNWANRSTNSLAGWINELGMLAENRRIEGGRLRAAMMTIFRGLQTHAATQPAAQGMDAQQYRLIERGELIEAGDQFLRDDFTWQIDPRGIFVGVPHGAALRPARRAIAAQAKQGGA